jgi:hypothetical protein
MITFEKSNEKKLPYDKKQYLSFLDDEEISDSGWYGFSLQVKNLENCRFEKELKEDEFNQTIDLLESAFKIIIATYDNGSFWTINHEYKDFDWFKNNDGNLTSLRTVFKQQNIPNSFKGSLICSKDDLFAYSRELISYPFILSYRNLDISHNALPLIIKITNHLSISVISSNTTLLNDFLKNNSVSNMNTVKYRGSEGVLF